MDWNEATRWVRETYRCITASTILPLWEFNLWTLPYLMTHGYGADFFHEFLKKVQPMLLKSMDGKNQELTFEEDQLVQLFVDRRKN